VTPSIISSIGVLSVGNADNHAPHLLSNAYNILRNPTETSNALQVYGKLPSWCVEVDQLRISIDQFVRVEYVSYIPHSYIAKVHCTVSREASSISFPFYKALFFVSSP